MILLKNLKTLSLIALILITSCKSDDPEEIPADFFVALPTLPVKVKNTSSTWLVYELHIKAPNLQKVDIFSGDDLQLSYDTFMSRDEINMGSIWLEYPQTGWNSEELKHEFHYKDAAGNQRQYLFNLKVDNQYPDPITVAFPVPQGIWIAEGAPGKNSYHTRSLFPYDEPLFDATHQGYIFGNNPQRYAIDYAMLVDGLPYQNDGSNIEDWYSYNLPILAAKGGKVIFTKDGFADNQTLFDTDYPTDATNASGNVVYIEHADGTIANYSHMIPNTILVEVGDIVTTGQELGRLGNSGNSFIPHLHMHVLTNPEGKQLIEYSDGLYMESLPYKFSEFTKLGQLPTGWMDEPNLTPFAPTMSEVYSNVLPSENDVIEF